LKVLYLPRSRKEVHIYALPTVQLARKYYVHGKIVEKIWNATETAFDRFLLAALQLSRNLKDLLTLCAGNSFSSLFPLMSNDHGRGGPEG